MSNTIQIVWSFEDIQETAKNKDIILTDDESREVLDSLKWGHDATIGINWEVIGVYIDNFIRDKKRK